MNSNDKIILPISDEAILKRKRGGESFKALARDLGVDPSSIRYRANRAQRLKDATALPKGRTNKVTAHDLEKARLRCVDMQARSRRDKLIGNPPSDRSALAAKRAQRREDDARSLEEMFALRVRPNAYEVRCGIRLDHSCVEVSV